MRRRLDQQEACNVPIGEYGVFFNTITSFFPRISRPSQNKSTRPKRRKRNY